MPGQRRPSTHICARRDPNVFLRGFMCKGRSLCHALLYLADEYVIRSSSPVIEGLWHCEPTCAGVQTDRHIAMSDGCP